LSQASPIKTYFWQLAKAGIAALGIVCISRFLGAEGRGELGLYLFYMQLALMLVEFVAGSAVANWLAQYKPSSILPRVAFVPILVAVLLMGVLPSLNADWSLLWFLLQFVTLAYLTIQYNLYQSQGWIERRNALQGLLELLKLAGFGALIYLGLGHEDCCADHRLSQVIQVLSVSALLVALLSLWRTRHIWRSSWPPSPWPPGLLAEGFWAQGGHLLLYLVYRVPIWTLNQSGHVAEAGVFANALLVADAFWLFANSFGSVLHSRVLRSNRVSFHARLLRRYTWISVTATVMACLLLLCVPRDWFALVFGPDFAELKSRCVELMPAILFLAASSSLGHYLHARGAFKALAFSYGVALLVLLLSLTVLNYTWSLDLAFAVLLVLNSLQVRSRINWSGQSQKLGPLVLRWLSRRF